jgi:hypothetical protein
MNVLMMGGCVVDRWMCGVMVVWLDRWDGRMCLWFRGWWMNGQTSPWCVGKRMYRRMDGRLDN